MFDAVSRGAVVHGLNPGYKRTRFSKSSFGLLHHMTEEDYVYEHPEHADRGRYRATMDKDEKRKYVRNTIKWFLQKVRSWMAVHVYLS